jgi:hypothetical protein
MHTSRIRPLTPVMDDGRFPMIERVDRCWRRWIGVRQWRVPTPLSSSDRPSLTAPIQQRAFKHLLVAEEIEMSTHQEEAVELQVLADRNGATAPGSLGPNHIIKECAKCGALGCNLIEANEIR